MTDPAPVLIRTAEAAKMLGLAPKTVRKAVHRGDIHAVAIGREMFMRREEVERFIARLPAWSTAAPR